VSGFPLPRKRFGGINEAGREGATNALPSPNRNRSTEESVMTAFADISAFARANTPGTFVNVWGLA
jgi:hypothetical protein